MKVYIVSQAVSDDDGNFYSTVDGVYLDKTKAISKVKEIHDEIVDYFNDPEDNYMSALKSTKPMILKSVVQSILQKKKLNKNFFFLFTYS